MGPAGCRTPHPFSADHRAVCRHAWALWFAWGLEVTLAEEGSVTLWPAAGLLWGVLAISPTAIWPAWILASLVGHTLGLPNGTTFTGLYLGIWGALQCAAAAWAVRRLLGKDILEARLLHGFGIAVATALLVPAAVGLATAPVVPERPFWDVWTIWWGANSLGMLLLAPAVIAWTVGVRQPLFAGVPRGLETIALVAALLLVTQVTLLSPPTSTTLTNLPAASVPFLLLPLLLWAAARFDTRIVTLAAVIIVLAAVWGTSHGLGPFVAAGGVKPQTGLGVQLFLLMLIFSALTLRLVTLDQAATTKALRTRLGLEEIILNLSARMVGAAAADLDHQISAALGELGEFAECDRVHLLQFDHDRGRFSGTHFWCRPGVESIDYLMRDRELKDFAWEIAQLQRGEPLAVRNMKQLPGEAKGLQMIHELSGRQAGALYYVPVMADQELLGVIGFSWMTPDVEWRDDVVALGQIIGQFFVNAILRSRAEGDLAEYQQKLRALAAEMSLAEERVRRRAAVDLHDGIGQYLAVARIKLGQLLGSGEPTLAAVEEVRDLVDAALKQTRYVISDLSPSVLYELGLVPAIRWLTERLEQQANFVATITEDGQPNNDDDEARVVIFQIVRELLTNIVKHAKATEVGIHVNWHPGAVQVVITDNGIGFRQDRLENLNPGTGWLRPVQHQRAAALHARCHGHRFLTRNWYPGQRPLPAVTAGESGEKCKRGCSIGRRRSLEAERRQPGSWHRIGTPRGDAKIDGRASCPLSRFSAGDGAAWHAFFSAVPDHLRRCRPNVLGGLQPHGPEYGSAGWTTAMTMARKPAL